MEKQAEVLFNVVNCRMVSFLSRLVSGKQSKYSYILYNLIKSMHVDSNTQSSMYASEARPQKHHVKR